MTLLNLNHFLIITQAKLCLKSTFVKANFMFVTIFLDMKILGEKTLTHPVQSSIKQLIEIKNDIIFILTLLCGDSEGFHLLEASKRSVRIKSVLFFPIIPLRQQGLRVRFVKLLINTISVSLTIETHKNIDTFRVTNKQYYKMILF